jgi:hypothetical protein
MYLSHGPTATPNHLNIAPSRSANSFRSLLFFDLSLGQINVCNITMANKNKKARIPLPNNFSVQFLPKK